MGEEPIEFEVLGLPAPQGSKTAIVVGGKARVVEGKAGQRARHADWRTAIAATARDIATDVGRLDGPLGLSVTFRFPMPASRPASVRKAGTGAKTTAPDLDKLLRALCDGLQAGGLITDDARICTLEAEKVETVGWTGAEVRITKESR